MTTVFQDMDSDFLKVSIGNTFRPVNEKLGKHIKYVNISSNFLSIFRAKKNIDNDVSMHYLHCRIPEKQP